MDIEKIRKWLEITNEYKKSDFWTKVLEQKYPEELYREKISYPKCDIYQNEYYNFIIFEIPGVNREDLSLNLISHTQLKISGQLKPLFKLEREVKTERTLGEFERVIDLPDATYTHLLNIQMDNGLLYISYPRKVEPVSFQ